MKKISSKLSSLLLGIGAVFVLGFIINYYITSINELNASKENNISIIEKGEKASQMYLSMVNQDSDLHFPAEGQYCLSCHQGIEPTRPLESDMMKEILEKGAKLGDPNGCVVCHGGTPSETENEDIAHSGVPKNSLLKDFTPVPGAIQVNENTCGQCHEDHQYNIKRSLMNTDAGKMKAITWSYGIGTENKDHKYADHDTDDPDGMVPRFGSEAYKAYMKEMAEMFPGQYPESLQQIPEASYEKLAEVPEEAAYTYLRNCNACHLQSKGLRDRGHFRGMGCAACHSVYSNEGFYEGGDESIDRKHPGHLLVHSMQGGRKSATKIHGKNISGVQVSTCAACHAAGRRIGHAYQGLMALGSSYNRGPFDENGMPQQTNAGYVFKYIKNDAHHRIEQDGKTVTGLLCQDCHTTNSMHGNGNIGSTTLATIEIECADCHGTPSHYPWELPLGYGEEFGRELDMDNARGLADEPMEVTKRFGITYPKEGGYLLSARGNALGNVVRRGNKVIVHSDAGHDFEVPVLKNITEEDAWQNPAEAKVAMVNIHKHIDNLECYACHSTWTPQYYGYKTVMDYTSKSTDWLSSSDYSNSQGLTDEYLGNYHAQMGAPVRGDYSHIRWENPPLGNNGEGRVSPLTGVIQTISTVIDKDGKTVVYNQIPKTEAGYNAMELAPIHPHTTSRESRECSDCHGNSATVGYGVNDGHYDNDPSIKRFADIVDSEGNNVSNFTKTQIADMKGLHGDLMQVLALDGTQLQTVDSHWPNSMPLTEEQRSFLARQNTCIACHQDIPKGSIPIAMLGEIAKVANLDFSTDEKHGALLRQNNILIAWIKAGGIVGIIILIPLLVWAIIERRKVMEFLSRFKKKD